MMFYKLKKLITNLPDQGFEFMYQSSHKIHSNQFLNNKFCLPLQNCYKIVIFVLLKSVVVNFNGVLYPDV